MSKGITGKEEQKGNGKCKITPPLSYSSPTTGEVGRVVEIALGGLAEQEVVEDRRGMSSVDG